MSLFGLAACPLTSSFPALQAFCASDRVLNRQVMSSQMSRRTPGESESATASTTYNAAHAERAQILCGLFRELCDSTLIVVFQEMFFVALRDIRVFVVSH